MSEKKWAQALDDLFESFKNYLDIADPRAKTILKYTILASILANSKVNYATTREAKTYSQDKEIMLINELRTAFEQNDIDGILRVMNHKDSHISDDPVISMYLEDLMRSIRLKVIVSRVKPYKTVGLQHLAKQLNVSHEEVCGLLSELILEEEIRGQIDQLNGYLILSEESKGTGQLSRHSELRKWASTLTQVHSHIIRQLNELDSKQGGGGGRGDF